MEDGSTVESEDDGIEVALAPGGIRRCLKPDASRLLEVDVCLHASLETSSIVRAGSAIRNARVAIGVGDGEGGQGDLQRSWESCWKPQNALDDLGLVDQLDLGFPNLWFSDATVLKCWP